jgi:putative transcriptional regulator
MSQHPLSDDLLSLHASGQAQDPVSLVVRSHCALVPSSARRLADLEALGGAGLDALQGVPMAPGGLDALLSRLDEPYAEPEPPRLPDFLQGIGIPEPMVQYLANAPKWRTVLPGFIHQIPLAMSWGATPVTLVRMRARTVVPMHSHSGVELNLVLQGGFDDAKEEYLPGDVAVKDPSDVHKLNIHDDGDCIVLVVRDGPLVPHGVAAQVASWLTGF